MNLWWEFLDAGNPDKDWPPIWGQPICKARSKDGALSLRQKFIDEADATLAGSSGLVVVVAPMVLRKTSYEASMISGARRQRFSNGLHQIRFPSSSSGTRPITAFCDKWRAFGVGASRRKS